MADEDGAVARRYGAWNKRTNDVQPLACIVDRSGKLVWQSEGAEALKPAALTAAFDAVVR
jgi:peroxiredoxin